MFPFRRGNVFADSSSVRSRMRGEDDGLLKKVDWSDLSPLKTEDQIDPELVYGEAVAGAQPGDEEEEMSEWNSFVVQQFEVQRNTIELFYNIPPPKTEVQVRQQSGCFCFSPTWVSPTVRWTK